MNIRKLLIAASFALGAAAGARAEDHTAGEGSDATAASVAALKSNLGNPAGLQVDEVRVTDAGVACIKYRMKNGQGGEIRGHAVVQGEEILKSSSDAERFEKVWNEHCLGPRGGVSRED